MKRYALDYGSGDKKKLVLYDGTDFYYPKSLSEVAEMLPIGSILVAEASLGSYGINNEYNDFLKRCKEKNITLLKISPRKTSRVRNQLDLQKTDENDTKIIYDIGFNSNYFKGTFEPRDFSLDPSDEDIERFKFKTGLLRRLRAERDSKYKKSKSWLKSNRIDCSSANCQAYILSSYMKELDLYDRKLYDKHIALYGLGYPSMLRSSFNREYLWAAIKRDYKEKGIVHSADKSDDEENGESASSKYRKELDFDEVKRNNLRKIRKISREIFSLVMKEKSLNKYFE